MAKVIGRVEFKEIRDKVIQRIIYLYIEDAKN